MTRVVLSKSQIRCHLVWTVVLFTFLIDANLRSTRARVLVVFLRVFTIKIKTFKNLCQESLHYYVTHPEYVMI